MKSRIAGILFASISPLIAQPEALPAPPQTEGLPYTRSAQREAIKALGEGITVFPGSRYGVVNGVRVRLSQQDLLHGSAFLKDDAIQVPAEFAEILRAREVMLPMVPRDMEPIADRWVFAVSDLVSVSTAESSGRWVSFESAAKEAGWKVSRHPSGFVHATRKPHALPDKDSPAADSIVTLFDTPEAFADPDIATRSIPILRRQGPWTDHVQVTPEQLAGLQGPVTQWTFTPEASYNLSGINTELFGSKVPPPGVYPRLLFSEADIPTIAARVKSSNIGRKSLIEMEHLLRRSWLDPKTSDGQVFEKLSTGDLVDLKWQVPEGKPFFEAAHLFVGQTPGIHNSHVAYVPECLTAIAMFALLTNDDALGVRAATAVANYYKLREPILDRWLEISDSEFGSSIINPDGTQTPVNAPGARTHWRNIHGIVAHMNLAFSLDLSGKWMTPEQKDLMRRVIAKATYGRRSHGQDGPVRVRDVNWMAWDLTHFLAVSAIEGLPGYDPEVAAVGRESVRAFCEWGVDPSGVIFESNGKSGAALQFQLLSMVVIARRGENLFAHPHWLALLEGQVQMTSPSGRVIPNSGTQYVPHSRQRISLPLVTQLKAFYPESRLPDYLITAAVNDPDADDQASHRLLLGSGFDAAVYRNEVKTLDRLRLPSVTYPGFVSAVLYDADVIPTTRADLGLPLDFDAPVHGVFSAYSDRTPDATWINLMVRPNHYLGGGHHHADAGMFHFSALGVDWITESPFTQMYSGNVHNLVIVDGKSQADGFAGVVANVVNGYNAPGRYLGATLSNELSKASADLTYAYTWRWNTQPPQVWSGEIQALPWEMDPSAEIAQIFAGTARMKWRPWWPNYNYSNFIATARAPFNPMEYVFRSTGLVRGPHPFGFVVDDVRKDDQSRTYEWTAMLNGGVWRAAGVDIPRQVIALATSSQDEGVTSQGGKPAIEPQPGDPLLLIWPLGMDDAESAIERLEGPPGRKGEKQFYNRVVVRRHADVSRFRVLLLPMRFGAPLPKVTYDPNDQMARIIWPDHQVSLRFEIGADQRSSVNLATPPTP